MSDIQGWPAGNPLSAATVTERPRRARKRFARAAGPDEIATTTAPRLDSPPPPQIGPPRPASEPGFRHESVTAHTRRTRAVHWSLTLLWALVNVRFWSWWLGPEARTASWLYWLASAALLYHSSALPSMYWFFVGRMRVPRHVAPQAGLRVAMITLCVPSSESLGVIDGQLRALAQVRHPHDSWVLDEGDDPAVRALAHKHGVHYFTRRGVERWNEAGPPFQRATKAGNVNAWLDHVRSLGGDYDVFVQMDIDHRPRKDYLDKVLGYFRDEQVAWVQAPSVCGNLDQWAARGLAEQDLVFQGPLQMGFYGHSGTPFIIGSHTTYRTSAVRQIGGFQPTRAEDHLDTVVLAANGYRGVFVPELIAVGDGPHDFATYLRQQFAWAYSMIQIFIDWTPRLIRRYTPAQALQFLMAQSWYTLWGLCMGALWLLPALALITNEPIAQVSLGRYLAFFLPVTLTAALMWCATRHWFQPGGVRLSWRGVILEVARWPVVLWALINAVLRIKRPYMITPKGLKASRPPKAAGLYGAYVVLMGLCLAAVWGTDLLAGGGVAPRYYLLTLANAAFALVLLATTLALELRQLRVAGVRTLLAIRWRAGMISLVCGLGVALALTCSVAWTAITGVLN
jgi:cellulose synthase (UDP-forming)